jgi:heme/copper-type cytochrome/quinol oxidase subunit 2
VLCARPCNRYTENEHSQKDCDLHNHADNSLAVIIFWIAAAICIVAELALLKSAFTPRAADAGAAAHASRASEMLWAIVPAIMLAALLAATWRAVSH